MKFEHIKVGDNVLLNNIIKSGFWNVYGESFWINSKVDRVTSKQFVADGKKFRKTDGYQISSKTYGVFALKSGDIYDGKKIIDQTVEMNYLVSKIKLAAEVNKNIEALDITYKTNSLKKILGHLTEINKIIKKY